MKMVTKSISVTNQQADWIQQQMNSGNYVDESEIIRDLIRERTRQEYEHKAIREALIMGEQSGPGSKSVDDIWHRAEVTKNPVR